MTTFADRLDDACAANQSLVCVGLDPDPSLMPVGDTFDFISAIVDATHDQVCAYKPNWAFYEALGLDGLRALDKTVRHIRDVSPGVILIADAKRGDIGNTSAAYARALFQVWGFDAATVNPYLGSDAVQPFLDYQDKGVFVLCRTSNPGSGDFQDLQVARNGAQPIPLYHQVALRAKEWNVHGNVGLVLGATYPSELAQVRELCPDLPFLVPGIGPQAGDLEQSVRCGTDARGRRAIINSSRGVIYASRGKDFAEAARSAAGRLRDSINGVLKSEGLAW